MKLCRQVKDVRMGAFWVPLEVQPKHSDSNKFMLQNFVPELAKRPNGIVFLLLPAKVGICEDPIHGCLAGLQGDGRRHRPRLRGDAKIFWQPRQFGCHFIQGNL